MENFTKEAIKQRMIRSISNEWDLEPENIDPIVHLLAEAMAGEITKLSGELDQSDDRILDKHASLFTPPQFLTARPAHALFRAYPNKTSLLINTDTVFSYTETRELLDFGIQKFELSPINPFMLVKADIANLNICGQFYGFEPDNRRIPISNVSTYSQVLNRSLWIGIDAESELKSLDKVSLYFDFPNVEDKHSYLKLLSCIKWTIEGEQVEVKYGIRAGHEEEPGLPFDRAALNFVMSDIRSLYDIHYITLSTQSGKKSKLPGEIEHLYDSETLKHFNKELFWLKAQFPAGVTRNTIESIDVGINIFPVANYTRKHISMPMSNKSLFIPLETENNEFFMEISSVVDTSGKRYLPEHSSQQGSDMGYYALRNAGVECEAIDKFSSAMRLTGVLRNRNLFSKSSKNNAFDELVKSANTAIDNVSDALNDLNETPHRNSYIIVDKSNKGETLHVDYLVTNGAIINNFHSKVLLKSNLGTKLSSSKIFLVTPMRAGENTPLPDKARDRFRHQICSNQTLYTRYDVKSFCKAEYSDIDSVEIKHGRRISKEARKGVQNTIDLHIKLKEDSSYKSNQEEQEELKIELLCKIESRSPIDYIYQIFIE